MELELQKQVEKKKILKFFEILLKYKSTDLRNSNKPEQNKQKTTQLYTESYTHYQIVENQC